MLCAMLEKMKPKIKKASSIIIFVICMACLIMFTAICLSLVFSTKDITSEQIGFTIVFMSVVDSILAFIGIYSLISGLRAYKSMTKGRKRECLIVNIEVSKENSCYREITVSYRGESGDKHESIVPIFFSDAQKLRVGQIIECYVLNENCYIDVDRPIKILKEPEEDLSLEY